MKFRDLKPDYEREISIHNREELMQLGCSEALADWLWAPNSNPRPFIVAPEDWFWRDRDWYKHTDRGIVEEIHAISGGTFGDLSVEEQCSLLDIPLVELSGQKSPNQRGKWLGETGPTSVEGYALEQLAADSDIGFSFEGRGMTAWNFVAVRRYERSLGMLPMNREFSSEIVDRLVRELRIGMADLDAEFSVDRAFYRRLWKPLDTRILKDFANTIGQEFLIRFLEHGLRNGIMSSHGHPDVTLIKNGTPTFVEVKATDRLRGSQARWICNVARPLGLRVSVARVRPA